MGRYDDLAPVLRADADSQELTPLTSLQIDNLRADYPQVTEDYVDFMREIGFGEIDGYMFYGELVPADEIYGSDTANTLGRVLLFGDDFQGYCAGFDQDNHWTIIEIDPIRLSIYKINDSFEEFVRKRFSIA